MENNLLELGGVDRLEQATGITAADRWREIVLRQKQSGLGPVAFCRAQGVPQSSFFAWRRKLSGQFKAASSAKGSAVRFARVKVKAVENIPSKASALAIEWRPRGRRCLIVRKGFDPQLLGQVVRVLESLGVDGRNVGGVS